MLKYASIRNTLAIIGAIFALAFVWHVIEVVSDGGKE